MNRSEEPHDFDPPTPVVRERSTVPLPAVERPVRGSRTAAYQPVLIILDGLDKGARHVLDRDVTVLGRGSDSDIVIQDEGVSRHHARITYENRGAKDRRPICQIEDMGSVNGTEVNGHLIERRTDLQERDRLTLGTAVIGFFYRDEEELDNELTLYERATSDALTGLDNRHKLLHSLEHLLPLAERYRAPLSVLVIDIDHFKSFNDKWGHDTGDTALRHLAGLLTDSVRNSDLVARWGGEEFVVVLPHTASDQAYRLAERFRQQVERTPLRKGDELLEMTVSIGLAQFEAGEDRDDMLKRADRRLYIAKEQGRNRVVHTGE